MTDWRRNKKENSSSFVLLFFPSMRSAVYLPSSSPWLSRRNKSRERDLGEKRGVTLSLWHKEQETSPVVGARMFLYVYSVILSLCLVSLHTSCSLKSCLPLFLTRVLIFFLNQRQTLFSFIHSHFLPPVIKVVIDNQMQGPREMIWCIVKKKKKQVQ